MNGKYRIFFIGIGFFLALLVGGLVVFALLKGKGDSGGNLPTYILSRSEEDEVTAFVKNFAYLYNTYSTLDTSNLTALGDYQTPEMQNKTLVLTAELQKKLPTGYSQTCEPLASTFKYTYPSAETLEASIEANIKVQITTLPEVPRQPVQETVRRVVIKYFLTRDGKKWLVSSQEISEQAAK